MCWHSSAVTSLLLIRSVGLHLTERAEIACINWGVRHLWTGPLLIATAQSLTEIQGITINVLTYVFNVPDANVTSQPAVEQSAQ
jgi:hypothetical protein